ncbi:hypothetical protein [Saccharothrix sp. HUAS TT1]|uniref:phage tail protein n=1 Tax=unclassified Saccharothrix TaxID=2593673 RepID=UPI00345C2C04
MALTIGTLVGYLKIDRSQWDRGLDRAHAGMTALGNLVGAIGSKSTLPMLALQAAQIVQAVGPATGALLAIPAVLGAIAFAMQTVKIGTQGVGEAMKAAAEGDAEKLNEALKGLSPSARAFVKAWQGVKDGFKPIQQAVQQNLFQGLDKSVTGLTKNTLPALGNGLKATAGELNGLAREGLAAASTPMFAGQLEQTGAGTADVLRELHGSVAPLPGAILGVVNAGLPFVRQLAAMAGATIKARAEFLGSEAGAEKMRATIQRGVDTIRQMIQIGQNLGRVVAGIFGKANVDGSNFLATIVDLTARMAAWVASAQGQEAIGRAFDVLAQAAANAGQVVPLVLDALQTLMSVVNSLPGPVKELALTALAWSIALGPIAGKLVAVGGAALTLLKGVGAIGTFTASVFRIVTASNAASAATARASAGIVARMVAASIAAVGAAARTVASWIAMGAAATVQAARLVAAWVMIAAGSVAQGAATLASMAVTAAGVVAGWVLMGVQSLVQAARMAAAWLIAMGPVGWVIAAVVALVALVIANWETVSQFTKDLWDKVWGWVKSAWQSIVDGVRAGVRWVLDAVAWLGELPGRVGAWFASVYNAAVGKLGELLSWLGGLPGRVLSALGDFGSLLLQAGKDLVNGLVRGIGNMGGAIRDKIMSFVQSAWDGVKSFFGIASPSKLMTWAGRMIGQGLVRGIDGMVGAVGLASDRLAVAATPDIAPVALGMTADGGAPQGSIAPGTGRGGDGRALVSIGTFVAQAGQSPAQIADELDWKSKGRG